MADYMQDKVFKISAIIYVILSRQSSLGSMRLRSSILALTTKRSNRPMCSVRKNEPYCSHGSLWEYTGGPLYGKGHYPNCSKSTERDNIFFYVAHILGVTSTWNLQPSDLAPCPNPTHNKRRDYLMPSWRATLVIWWRVERARIFEAVHICLVPCITVLLVCPHVRRLVGSVCREQAFCLSNSFYTSLVSVMNAAPHRLKKSKRCGYGIWKKLIFFFRYWKFVSGFSYSQKRMHHTKSYKWMPMHRLKRAHVQKDM